MTKIKYFILAAAAALAFTACGAPAVNAPANNAASNTNSNTNNSKPVSAAPTKDALMALEKSAYEAWKTKDTKFWDTFLTDNFVGFGQTGRMDKAAAIKQYSGADCDVKSYALSDDKMTLLGADAAVITYKATYDGTCGGQKLPASVWASGVYVRSGDKWKGAFHAETPVVDPKAAPAKPTAAAPAKKDEAKPADAKPDAATEALLAVETKAWEAWKTKDAKALDDFAGKDMVSLDTATGWTARDVTLKRWADPSCDIKSFTMTSPASTAFNSDYSILTFRVAVDGKCGTESLTPEWDATIYGKEGGAWKAMMTMGVPVS